MPRVRSRDHDSRVNSAQSGVTDIWWALDSATASGGDSQGRYRGTLGECQ